MRISLLGLHLAGLGVLIYLVALAYVTVIEATGGCF
jgi:hypothetical protein